MRRATMAIAIALMLVSATAGCNKVRPPGAPPAAAPAGAQQQEGVKRTMQMTITSPAFKDGAGIPSRHTCDGVNVSPALDWSGVPEKTASIALICDDPDAPGGTWVHWVIYSIPPGETSLPESTPPERTLPDGAKQGTTDFRKIGYGGPCPPSGTHRYMFKLYALDIDPKLEPGATKAQLEQTMRGHILAHAQLTGTYKRQR